MYINQAKFMRRPSQLRNKVEDTYNGIANAYDKVKQTEKLLVLLLLLAKMKAENINPLSVGQKSSKNLFALVEVNQ